jgi:ADP-heptose:LPS heptosyltransferase
MLAGIRRVLIVRCGALGDLVSATGVVDAVRREYGDAVRIDMVCTPRAAGLFDFDSRVEHVHPLRHRHLPLWASVQKRAIVRASRRAPYDLLINLESGQQFESLVRAIAARHKVGWFFTDPRPQVGIHGVQMYLSVASPALSAASREASVPRVYGASPDDVRRRFGLPTRYLAMSPGNSHRCWR